MSCVLTVSILLGVAGPASAELVGWWNFESGYSDVSGNNLGGTAVGTAAIVTDATRGQVLSLSNSEASYVEVADNALLDISDAITVSAWVYAINGGPDTILSKGHWSDSYSTRLDDNSPRNVINFHGRSTTNGGGVSSTGAVPTGEWVHVAVTFDVSALGDDTSFYINGVLDSTADYGSALSLNDYALRIGNSISGSWSYWNGMIDDVQIYNTALNAGQIQTVMAGNIIPEPSTIVLAASGLLCLGLFVRRRRT